MKYQLPLDLQTQTFLPTNVLGFLEENNTEERKKQFLAQLDYVWPIDENTQFEAGYRTTNENQDTGFTVLNEIAEGTMIVDEYLARKHYHVSSMIVAPLAPKVL